jgi:hypothetical protein
MKKIRRQQGNIKGQGNSCVVGNHLKEIYLLGSFHCSFIPYHFIILCLWF